MKEKPKILYITSIPSPFMLEFADALNRSGKIDFLVACTTLDLSHRAKHWASPLQRTREWLYLSPQTSGSRQLRGWLADVYEAVLPQILMVSATRGTALETAQSIALKDGIPLGFWLEQPHPSSFLVSLIKDFIISRQLGRKADFILAVGDRAAEKYSDVLGRRQNVVLFPYYQDLSPCFSIPDRSWLGKRPVHFLFSGRLVQRNNIRGLMSAFDKLARVYHGRFTFCISAVGPEQKVVERYVRRSETLTTCVSYDIEFTHWEDRLRPFSRADVLIVPAFHSGWGLVVPEALASGMMVIATRDVESARYYLEHMINGILITPSIRDIYASLEYCILNPQDVQRMQKEARRHAMKGNVQVGTRRFLQLIQSFL